MFRVDFTDLANKLLPPQRRKPVFKDYLKAAFKPLQQLNDILFNYRRDTRYKLAITGQVIYLEHYLNDLYDPVLRRIYIADTASIEYDYLYNVVETGGPMYLYNAAEAEPPIYLENYSEIASADSFIVMVPVAVTYDETVMRSQIDQYKAAGRQYSIDTF